MPQKMKDFVGETVWAPTYNFEKQILEHFPKLHLKKFLIVFAFFSSSEPFSSVDSPPWLRRRPQADVPAGQFPGNSQEDRRQRYKEKRGQVAEAEAHLLPQVAGGAEEVTGSAGAEGGKVPRETDGRGSKSIIQCREVEERGRRFQCRGRDPQTDSQESGEVTLFSRNSGLNLYLRRLWRDMTRGE